MAFAANFHKSCTQLRLGKRFGKSSIWHFLCVQVIVQPDAVIVGHMMGPGAVPSMSLADVNERQYLKVERNQKCTSQAENEHPHLFFCVTQSQHW